MSAPHRQIEIFRIESAGYGSAKFLKCRWFMEVLDTGAGQRSEFRGVSLREVAIAKGMGERERHSCYGMNHGGRSP